MMRREDQGQIDPAPPVATQTIPSVLLSPSSVEARRIQVEENLGLEGKKRIVFDR